MVSETIRWQTPLAHMRRTVLLTLVVPVVGVVAGLLFTLGWLPGATALAVAVLAVGWGWGVIGRNWRSWAARRANARAR